MRATIQQNIDLAFTITNDDYFVLADPVHEEITGSRYLAFMTHEVPATGKDPFQFLLVDRFVGKNVSLQRAGLWVKTLTDINLPVSGNQLF